jgi:hypothetical protein
MNSSRNLRADQKSKLALFVAARRRFFYGHIISEVLYFVGLVGLLLSGEFVISRSKSELYSAILSVFMTVLGLLYFALITLKERSTRRNEIVKLLKSRHTDFFEWVRSDVISLIEKGRTDEILPGRSE